MNDKRISRRDFLRSAGLTGVGLALVAVGCQPQTTQEPKVVERAPAATPRAESEPVEIKYWHTWAEQWEEMAQYFCDTFNEKNPNIHAKQEVIPWGELMPRLLSSVAAGNPPDMVTIFSGIHIPSLVEQDALVPMADEDVPEAKDWFHPAVLDLGEYKGKIWGLSRGQETTCLGWNKNTFEEVGLDPEKPPTTIAELDEMAEKLTKYVGDRIYRMGHMPAYYWMWAAVWGGSWYDEDNQKVTANDPKNIEMFEWMASYSKKYDVTKVQAFEKGLYSARVGIRDPLTSGRIAIHEIGGPWWLSVLTKYVKRGFRYGIIPAPNPPGMTGVATFSHGDFTVVPKGTKHPVEAWKFVKYMGGLGGTLDDYLKILTWGDQPWGVPVTTKILDYEPFKKLVAEFPGFQEMIDMFFKGDRVGMPPKMPVGTYYWDRLNVARDRIRLLEVTPKEAMDQVTEEVQKELDDLFAAQG